MTEDDAVERAVAALEALELTEYQARCFVGLLQIGRSTAREVSQAADIPRSRIYDLADDLSVRGLVVSYDTTPRTFQAVAPEAALRTLRRDHRERTEAAAEALAEVERVEPSRPAREGGTTVRGRGDVLGQCRRLIETADQEVLLLVASGRRASDLLEGLTAAIDRGVSVLVGVHNADARAQIASELPGATVFEPLPGWSEFAGSDGVTCVLLVDRGAVLMSTHDGGREIAVWDHDAGLTTVLIPILERQISHARGRERG